MISFNFSLFAFLGIFLTLNVDAQYISLLSPTPTSNFFTPSTSSYPNFGILSYGTPYGLQLQQQIPQYGIPFISYAQMPQMQLPIYSQVLQQQMQQPGQMTSSLKENSISPMPSYVVKELTPVSSGPGTTTTVVEVDNSSKNKKNTNTGHYELYQYGRDGLSEVEGQKTVKNGRFIRPFKIFAKNPHFEFYKYGTSSPASGAPVSPKISAQENFD